MKRKRKLGSRAAWEVRGPRPQTMEVNESNWRDVLAGRYGPRIVTPNATRTGLIATIVPRPALPAVRARFKQGGGHD